MSQRLTTSTYHCFQSSVNLAVVSSKIPCAHNKQVMHGHSSQVVNAWLKMASEFLTTYPQDLSLRYINETEAG